MFENFPKIRIELPDEFLKIYKTQYKQNRDGKTTASSLSQKLEGWMHKKIACNVLPDQTTLEIGAGTLNHLRYEKTINYDIIEPFNELFQESPLLKNIQNVYSDIAEIPVMQYYDRIISIATFEHILNLPDVVAKSVLLLKPNGTLRVAIPNEGSYLWTLGWKMTTGLEFKLKYGLDYGLLMKHEHVNNANEIEEVLHYFFNTIKLSNFGIGKSLALYRFYECSNPDIVKASHFAKNSD